jgi:hypothetical protein
MIPIDLEEDSRRRFFVTAALYVEVTVISSAGWLSHGPIFMQSFADQLRDIAGSARPLETATRWAPAQTQCAPDGDGAGHRGQFGDVRERLSVGAAVHAISEVLPPGFETELRASSVNGGDVFDAPYSAPTVAVGLEVSAVELRATMFQFDSVSERSQLTGLGVSRLDGDRERGFALDPEPGLRPAMLSDDPCRATAVLAHEALAWPASIADDPQQRANPRPHLLLRLEVLR